MLYYLFFYEYDHPRDLHGQTHPFPTRRSSDLEEDIHVAVAFRPDAGLLRPAVERVRVIAGFDIVLAALEPRIGEVGGLFVDAREFVAVGINHRHVALSQHVDEGRVAEAFVPDFDRVAQRPPVLRVGEQVEAARELVANEERKTSGEGKRG